MKVQARLDVSGWVAPRGLLEKLLRCLLVNPACVDRLKL